MYSVLTTLLNSKFSFNVSICIDIVLNPKMQISLEHLCGFLNWCTELLLTAAWGRIIL